MTTSTVAPPEVLRPDAAPFTVAGAFLEGLASQDYSRIAATLGDTADLSALLPSGPAEWHGPEQISGAFRRWFGEVDRFQLVDAAIGEVGPRLHLRWRVRVQAPARGEGWLVIEQQLYADAGTDGRLTRLSLLCSGFHPEPSPRPNASALDAPTSARSPR